METLIVASCYRNWDNRRPDGPLGSFIPPLTEFGGRTYLLLTEREGRTGECWPEVVTVRTEHREVRTKNDRGPIFLSTARAS